MIGENNPPSCIQGVRGAPCLAPSPFSETKEGTDACHTWISVGDGLTPCSGQWYSAFSGKFNLFGHFTYRQAMKHVVNKSLFEIKDISIKM